MHKTSSNEWTCQIFDSNNKCMNLLAHDEELLKK